jgi:ribosomal-protein-alanine N-acetyltransferase
MRAADIEAVVAIESEAFTTPWQPETFLGLLDRPGVELIVMEDAAEGVIGYAVLWCISDQGELANVAVAPGRRGQGLGRYLIGRVLHVARKRGVKKVYLEVRASNERALELYGAFGFRDVGVRPGYYDHPKEDARIMMAQLE